MTDWKIVPVESDEEMDSAADALDGYSGAPYSPDSPAKVYAAMLTASPDASLDEGLLARCQKAAEYAAEYDDDGYYNESHRYICNWDEIVFALLTEINQSQSND